MKKIILFFACFLSAVGLSAQLTIEDCQEKARNNYPLIRQHNLIEQSQHYSVANANRGYLPQIFISGQATYQSDVTKIDVPIPNINIEEPAKDQYQVIAEVSQTVWDGGIIRSKKKIAKASEEVEKQRNEVNIYGALQERINQLYFGILLLNEQLKQHDLLQQELQINYDRISAFVQNGIANQSDIDIISVEILRSNQQKVEIKSLQKSYMQMLSSMIGETVNNPFMLVKPDYQELILAVSTENNRPELKLFDAQKELYSNQIRSVKAINMPKINLFARGGYARPGLNLLSNDFEPFYIAGVKLAWNISGFYTQKNNIQNIKLNQQSVEVQRASFLFNTNLRVIEQQNAIEKAVAQLKSDDEIIRLRNNVKTATAVKVENGTSSTSDLVRDINAASLSVQNKTLHEMQLLISIYNLKAIQNN